MGPVNLRCFSFALAGVNIRGMIDFESLSNPGAAERVQDWSDHLKEPQFDNYWSDQNSENARL